MGEMLVADQDRRMQLEGAPPRDLSAYTGWRDEADPENLDLIDFYCRFGLANQTNGGFSTAMSLQAVATALEIDQVPREEWPERTERLIRLHALVDEHRPKKQDG